MESLEEQYRKQLADSITVSIEDLSANEAKLISESFTLFKHKLSDIKTLNDEIYRLEIQLANLKAMYVEDMGKDDEDDDDDEFGGACRHCGRDDSHRNDY